MKHILSYMRRAIEDYDMIEDGDKIAVALSGGKDSITLLNGLKSLQYFYPKKFELIAISVNPGFEYFDSEFLKKTCDDLGVPFFEEKYDISKIVFEDKNKIHVLYVLICVGVFLTLLQNVSIATRLH